MPHDEQTLTIPATDGRTIEELKVADSYEEFEIESCKGGTITTTEGTGFGLPLDKLAEWIERTGHDPEPGMKGRLYPGGLGQIHGVDLDGVEVFWNTPAERIAARAQWLADYDREQREEFAEKKGQLDRDYESLPDPLKKRIDRFRADDDGFRVTSEGYEMFCCTEAAKFAERARAAEKERKDEKEVDAFWAREDRGTEKIWSGERPETYAEAWLLYAWAQNSDLYDYDHKHQKELLGNDDGHSGNTFGGACALALGLLQGREL